MWTSIYLRELMYTEMGYIQLYTFDLPFFCPTVGHNMADEQKSHVTGTEEYSLNWM